MLDNPEGTEEFNDDVLESKLRQAAEQMTKDAADARSRPEPEAEVEPEAEEREDHNEPPEAKQPTPEPQKYRVKVDSDELEVTLDELLNGYSRQADYTRKMQGLAEERRLKVDAPKTQYEQLNSQLISQLKAFMPEKPDVAMLNPNSDKYNPDQYHLHRANFEAFQEHLTAAETERTRLSNERAQEANQASQARMQEVSKEIVKAIPEWKDQKVMQEDTAKMKAFLGSQGASEDDINAWIGSPIFGPMSVKILKLAVQGAAATDQTALAAAKVKDVPPVMKPGAAQVKDTDSAEVQRLKAAVKRNPRDDRTVAALWAAQDKQAKARANRR